MHCGAPITLAHDAEEGAAVSTAALGVGLATFTDAGRHLDTWYPYVTTTITGGAGALAEAVEATHGTRPLETRLRALAGDDDRLARALGAAAAAPQSTPSPLGTRVEAVVTVIDDLDTPPVDGHDVYLRLHLLSHRLIAPHGANLEGAFGLLTNVAWTDLGPADPERIDALRLDLAADGRRLRIRSVDKFPRMTDYVVPGGVRIGDADRVRLGAHLAAGTTVMHAGFVNFNAGTLGASMVEGRISAGVVVGDGSDLGGGSSIMGTLSGGGTEVLRVGERCLVGANAGIGISLGDDCVVEAGLYVTAGTKVTLEDGTVVKAETLSGADRVLFRRDSQTGQVTALDRSDDRARWGGLNATLHAND
jgi:2,3,4,5-tetrahydropyridine-2,6-dicarboxylate N-succinyltransferase